MENKHTDINELLKTLTNFCEKVFQTKDNKDKSRTVRFERVNGELLIDGKETLYKQLQK